MMKELNQQWNEVQNMELDQMITIMNAFEYLTKQANRKAKFGKDAKPTIFGAERKVAELHKKRRLEQK